MMTVSSAILLILALAITAHADKQEVTFSAADGVALKGTLYSADKPAPGVLLLPQCDANRQASVGAKVNTPAY